MDITDLKKEQEFVEKANLLDRQGQYRQAIEAYNQALGIVQDDADVIFDMGQTLAKLGQVPEAMKCFETATRMYISGPG